MARLACQAVGLLGLEGMVRPVKALCPSCGSEVEVPPTGEWFDCPRCGARTRSMVGDLAKSGSPLMRGMAERAAAQAVQVALVPQVLRDRQSLVERRFLEDHPHPPARGPRPRPHVITEDHDRAFLR